MGIWIPIRKYHQENDLHFYKLYSSDNEQIAAYMKIDAANKIISYSRCPNFTQIDSEVDLNNPDGVIKPIENVNFIILSKSFAKAYRALKDQHFPEFLDFCS